MIFKCHERTELNHISNLRFINKILQLSKLSSEILSISRPSLIYIKYHWETNEETN